MKTKKILSLLLALAMTMALLAGCGETEAPAQGGEETPAETEAVTDEPLMGDVVWEGEPTEEVPTELATEPATEPEETDEETADDTSEETTEPEIVDIMGEPAE